MDYSSTAHHSMLDIKKTGQTLPEIFFILEKTVDRKDLPRFIIFLMKNVATNMLAEPTKPPNQNHKK